jgi:hypothetical protein
MAKTNGSKQEIIPIESGMPNLDQLTAKEREQFMQAFRAGVGAAAALHGEPEGVNVKEFYGQSPNDLRREFTTLPKPAQGGSRRPSQRIDRHGNTGPVTK